MASGRTPTQRSDLLHFFANFKDVRAQNFPHTDFVKTLTAGRE